MAKHPPEENPLTAIVDEFTEKDAGGSTGWYLEVLGQYWAAMIILDGTC